MRCAVWLRPSGRRVRVKSCELMRRAAPAARTAARNLASWGRVHCSAESTSRSTMWQPVSAALRRISSSALRDPVNLPPKGLRRQVAMAVMSRRRLRRDLISGRTAAGLGRLSRRNSMKGESLSAASTRDISSAGVAPWTAIHSFPTRRRGRTAGAAAGASIVLETVRGILFN